jgi:hypothetical protein
VQGTGEPKPVTIQVTNGEIAQTIISIAQGLLDSKTEGLYAFPHSVHIRDDYANVGARPTMHGRKVLLLVEKQAPVIETQGSESAVAALQPESQRAVKKKRTFEIADGQLDYELLLTLLCWTDWGCHATMRLWSS